MSQLFPLRKVTQEGSEISLKDTRMDKRPMEEAGREAGRPDWRGAA